MTHDAAIREEQFIQWGVSRQGLALDYAKQCAKILSGANKLANMLAPLLGETECVFEIDDPERVEQIYKDARDIPENRKEHNRVSAAVMNYKKFLLAPDDDPSEYEEVYEDGQYTKRDFLNEAFLDSKSYDTLVELLETKRNLILQGPPGVGKTFIAKRLAYSILGKQDKSKVQLVQFHQSYSYEDFIMGYRPTEEGFLLKEGPFYSFCKHASADKENSYYFIIDEINRGNISKIFGELLMLIEGDKRGEDNSLQLLYSDEEFYVPENVFIIGMMNTADRSLAMLDYALRRRFAFYTLSPAFETEGFKAYVSSLASKKMDSLIDCVISLNKEIAEDVTLGEGFCIGHSYFCGLNAARVTDTALSNIVNFELVPLVQEYWFDESSKVDEWTSRLQNAVK